MRYFFFIEEVLKENTPSNPWYETQVRPVTGANPAFSNTGGAKDYVRAASARARSMKSPTAVVRACLLRAIARCSRTLDALSCYLSLIFKHSDNKRGLKGTQSIKIQRGRAPVAPPLDPPLRDDKSQELPTSDAEKKWKQMSNQYMNAEFPICAITRGSGASKSWYDPTRDDKNQELPRIML